MGLVAVAGATGAYALDVFEHKVAVAAASTLAGLAILFVRGGSLGQLPWGYFETDRFTYRQGEEMLVVLTNFTAGPMWLHGNVWEVYPETDRQMNKPESIDITDLKPVRTFQEAYKIPPDGDHRWRCSTANLEPGLYRIPYKGRSLSRKRRWVGLRYKPERVEGPLERKRRWMGLQWRNPERVLEKDKKSHEEERPLWLTTTLETSKEGRYVVRGRGIGRLCFGGRRVEDPSVEES